MKQKKLFSHIGMAYFLLAILTIGLQILLSLILRRTGVLAGADRRWALLLGVVPMYVVAMPVCAGYLRKLQGRQLFEHRITCGRWLIFFMMCIFVMLAGNLLGNAVCAILSRITGLNMAFDLQQVLLSEGLGMTFLISVVLAPILEELIFRKLLIDRAIVLGDRTAILLSGFLFGLFHGNFHQVFYAFGLGCMLAYLYIRTGKLRYPVSIHMAVNMIGGFLPMLFLKRLNLDLFLGNGGSIPSEMYSYLFQHLGAVLGYAAFMLLFFGAGIAGLVFFILSVKKTILKRGEYSLPAGEMLRVMFANPGMILFCISCVLLFVMDLL